MHLLDLRLLGGFHLTLGDEEQPAFHSDKVRALLAFLAAEPERRHRREKLAGLLWPEMSERRARMNLRRALANLRQTIKDKEARPPFLHIDRQSVGFNLSENTHVDVSVFTAAAAQLQVESPQVSTLESGSELYRGAFLEGFSVPDSAAFEEWILARRRSFEQLALRLNQSLASLYLEFNQHDRAIEFAQRALEIDPYEESTHQQVMWLLASSGQRSQALQHYDQMRRLFDAELGVQPLSETQDLLERIAAGDLPEPPQTILVIDREPRQVGESPYRGLASFREEDSQFFFGRERFVEILVRSVDEAAGPTVLIGPSGAGKSSVLRAGLIARLRQDPSWTITYTRPGPAPFQALSEALLRISQPANRGEISFDQIHALEVSLRAGQPSLHDWIRGLLQQDPRSDRFLLIVDQLEELFSESSGEDVINLYLDALLSPTLANDAGPEPTAKVLLSMRADFMGELLQREKTGEILQQGSLFLGPMSGAELESAIEKPASAQGAGFETGLVERILVDVGHRSGNLPLLEFALTELWENLDQGWMTHAAYEEIGTIQGALARYADSVFERLSDHERQMARSILIQLIHPGAGIDDLRRIATRAELGERKWPVVQTLADQRLLVTSHNEAGEQTVEIVHEALIRSWDRLRTWMDEDRAFRVWQEDLRSSLRQWQTSEQDPGALLRGVPLSQAELQLERRSDYLSHPEREYIRASINQRDAEASERERSRRQTVIGLVTGLAIALALAFLALNQWRRADREARFAASRELAQAAVANLDVDPELSLLLALESIQTTRAADGVVLPQAEEVLRRAIQGIRLRLAVTDETASKGFVVYSPDGKHIATWDDSSGFPGTMEIRKSSTGELVSQFDGIFAGTGWPHGERMMAAQPGPDGPVLQFWDPLTSQAKESLIFGYSGPVIGGNLNADWTQNAVVLEDGSIEVWDMNTGQPIQHLGPGAEAAQGIVTFSPDGAFLAAVYEPGIVRAWSLPGGELLATLGGHAGNVSDLQFSSDGDILVTAGTDNTARIWETGTWEQVAVVAGHDNELTSIDISSDNQILVTASWDRQIKIWDLPATLRASSGVELGTLSGHPFAVSWVDLSPDSTELVSVSLDGSIRFWEIDPALSGEGPTFVHGDKVPSDYSTAIELSPDGSRLAATNFERPPAVWDSQTAELLFYLTGHEGIVQFLDQDDHGLLATSGGDRTVRLWDAETGESILVLEEAGCDGCRVRLNSSHDMLAVVDFLQASGLTADVRLLDLEVALSGATADLDQLTRLTVPTISDFVTGGTYAALSFSPDGRLVATIDPDFDIMLWDVETGELDMTLTGHQTVVYGVAFRPDGKLIASSDQDGDIHVWDAATGDPLYILRGHQGSVFRTAFHPTQPILASASYDGTAKLWDLETGQMRLTLYGHSAAVTDVKFSPQGERLYTASNDGTVKTYFMDLEQVLALARRLVPRSLTEEECLEYPSAPSCEKAG